MVIETLLVLGGAAWLAHKFYYGPKEEEERSQANAAKADKTFAEFLAAFFIIDSNIWMNEQYDAFFAALLHLLKSQHKTMLLYGPQFDEICNIKKNTDFGQARNRRARCAINRVEDFQKEGVLTIKPINIDAQERAYADPLIIKLLLANARQGNAVAFVSDDKELRVRARQLLQEKGNGTFQIIEGDELAALCPDYCNKRLGRWFPKIEGWVA